MKIPFSYSLRNLWIRRLTTSLTIGGMALVVFVFAAVLMLAEGLQKTLVDTGSDDNVVVTRKSAGSEVQSAIDRVQASIIETQSGIAVDADGRRMVAKEIVVLIALPKKSTNKPSNVVIRGIGDKSLALRRQVKISEGRMPFSGSTEIIIGKSIAKRFKSGKVGEVLRFGMRDWRIVGIFDAGNTGFSSEVWGDADILMQTFRRQAYSSVIFRLQNPSEFEIIKQKIESDPRLTLEARKETKYYRDQSEMMAKFLRILGISLTVIFSLGAIIGAIITMYAAVANRITEIGTLRALGFRRRSILVAFLFESLFLGLIGGLAGLIFASFLQFYTISTMNWATFSELAFSFELSPDIIWKSIIFSLTMGLTGGMLPAIRASRINIVEALRGE